MEKPKYRASPAKVQSIMSKKSWSNAFKLTQIEKENWAETIRVAEKNRDFRDRRADMKDRSDKRLGKHKT